MKTFQYGRNTLYISNERLNEQEKRALMESPKNRISGEELIRYIVNLAYLRLGIYLNNQEKFIDFCKKVRGKTEDLRVGVLDAHGDSFLGRWCYLDGFFPKRVQSWIDEHDGFYDLLVLHSCNPKREKPIVRKSLAVIPTDNLGLLYSAMRGGIEHLLVIPEKGVIPFDRDKLNQLSGCDLLKRLQRYLPETA